MSQLSRIFLLLLVLTASMVNSKIHFFSPEGKTVVINFKEKTTSLADCPQSCGFCFADGKDVICTSCTAGYYLDRKNNRCLACAAGCQNCKGPNMEQCSFLENGVVFDAPNNRKITCPKGCVSCDQDGNCSSCEQGYLAVPEKDEKGTKQSKYGHNIVSCQKCKDSNCLYCDMPDNAFAQVCVACKQKYGLSPFDQKCEECSAHCLSCQHNSFFCNYCEEGYYLNCQSKTCDKISDLNCGGYNSYDKSCSWCKDGYFLDPISKHCTSCSIVDKLCSRCYVPPTSIEDPYPQLQCTECINGMHFDKKKKECLVCAPHCNFCRMGGFCQGCKDGFYLNSNKCVKVDIPNCYYQKDKSACVVCEEGYFIDGNSCSKCDESCYSCNGPSSKNCASCPVSKFSLYEEIKDFKNGGRFMGDISIDFYLPPKQTCISDCPRDTPHYDPISRECKSEDHPKEKQPESKFNFKRSPKTGETIGEQYEGLLNDASDFEVSIGKYADELKANMNQWAQKYPDQVGNLSPTCNYLGYQQEKLSRFREVIYQCKCKPGYFGPYCSVSRVELGSIENFVVDLLTDLNNIKQSISQAQFYSVFKKLLIAPLRTDRLNNFSAILKQAHPMFKSDSPWDFLSAMDILLHAHYNHFRETERALTDQSRDIDKSALLDGIYQRLHQIIDDGQRIMSRSLKHTAEYPLSQTSSFQNVYLSCEGKETKFNIYPSDLRGTNKESNQVEVKIIINSNLNNPSDYGILGWVFSSLLFGKEYGTKGIVISYVVAIQFVEKSNGELPKSTLSKDDELWIQFPLRVNPDTSTFYDQVHCLKIEVNHAKHTQHVTPYLVFKSGFYNYSDNMYVYCKYSMDVIDDTFYTVGYGSESNFESHNLNSQAEITDRFAMNSDDGFEIANYPGGSSGGHAFLRMIEFVFMALTSMMYLV